MSEYHFDGFTIHGNPSKIGGGFTIKSEDGFLFTHKILRNPVLFDGRPFTNNEGELLGAVFAAAMAPVGTTLVTDSKNTIAWLASANPKARPDLKWLCALGAALIKQKNLTLKWLPRDYNLAGQHNEFELGV